MVCRNLGSPSRLARSGALGPPSSRLRTATDFPLVGFLVASLAQNLQVCILFVKNVAVVLVVHL